MHRVTIKSSLTGREVTADITSLFLLENDEETLVQNLTDCGCQPVGETNVVDCECYLEWEDYTITLQDIPITEIKTNGVTPTEQNKEIVEFIKNLRSQAETFQSDALDRQGTNFEIKLVATMYAYKEIADELENKFINQTWDGNL